MKYLKAEIAKIPCAFVLHMQDPTDTLRRLAMFFGEQRIIIDNLNTHRYSGGDATAILHCQIVRERLSGIIQLLEELPGIIDLEMMGEGEVSVILG